MNYHALIILLAVILVGCNTGIPSSNQNSNPSVPQTTLILGDATSKPELENLSLAAEIDSYTRDLHDRVRNCVEFRDVYDFSFEGDFINHSLGTRKVRECLDFLLELKPPGDCQECQQLMPLVEGFSNQTLASMDLIDLGYETQKEVFIAEGLVTFWDGDLIWEAIGITIDRIRTKYKLPGIE
jgi:hypothetical protein